jgi:hypothetical protein
MQDPFETVWRVQVQHTRELLCKLIGHVESGSVPDDGDFYSALNRMAYDVGGHPEIVKLKNDRLIIRDPIHKQWLHDFDVSDLVIKPVIELLKKWLEMLPDIEAEPVPKPSGSNQCDCLDALIILKATSRDSGVPRSEVATKAFGMDEVDRDSMTVDALRGLKSKGYANSTTGRSAKWWATKKGINAADYLRV